MAVMWVAAAVFVIAVGNLAMLAFTYYSDAHRYDEIAKAVEVAVDDKTGLADMTVDWDSLRAVNPEVVAWVRVPGTRIDYPVCYSGDNTKYLETNFDGDAGVFTGSGAIFLDGEARPDFSCPCNFLFGHHMKDGSMFACLSDFADQDVFDANRTVYLFTPTASYEYRTFAVVRTVGDDYLVVHDFADAAERAGYVADKESRSLAQPSEGFPEPEGVSTLLALSTCDYNEPDGRAVLYAQLVDKAML